ncbi:MAG: NADP-specific glutamate dehydrogenase [Clostridia bacterium]|nr:NADP-specific glutamate dehydrogenase [Clostridia bacterium]
MNEYMTRVMEIVKKRNEGETEFIQSVEEVFKSLEVVIDAHPEYEKVSLLERIVEPERVIHFRVPWIDDHGNVQVNRGYRVQFNNAIGPYKGGLRFQHNVYLGIMKFLAFEQTFKNSLTGLPIGGAKGGSDFDPTGKSDFEIMRFCQSFMTELYRHIGADIDVPAGDIGVGAREIGFLYGQYKRITGQYESGVITGKGISYGGSFVRPEATGYGAVYYVDEVLKHFGENIEGKTFAISGYGNVAWGVASKVAQLGGKVVTLSDMTGYIYDKEGVITEEKINYMLELRANTSGTIKDYAEKFGVPFYPGKKPWGVKVDIVMPCATQNEVTMKDAKKIVKAGVKYYAEVSNMSTDNEALEYLKQNCLAVCPSKAVNAGGVAVSALEMTQDSIRYSWTAEKVDKKLHQIMVNIYNESVRAAEAYGLGYDLVAGANIAGFEKVANAMMAYGIV